MKNAVRIYCALFFLLICVSLQAGVNVVPFDSLSWELQGAQVVEHLGRECVMGRAVLKDVEFENGIIEVDIAVNGNRSYPGISFRMQSPENYEEFYIRPHRSKFYPDVLQYTPVINGVAGWQLYSGPGFTAGATVPANEWIHLKLEVKDDQARLFFNNSPEPALVIPVLKHGKSKGAIGVFGPKDKSAYFSNFEYQLDASLEFPSKKQPESPPGIIKNWELSQAFKASEINDETAPSESEIKKMEWQPVQTEASGLVDLARFVKKVGREPFCVFARTTLTTQKSEMKKILFGYSDAISVFLNGEIVYQGNSSYRFRDPSFLGIIGLFDAVHLPLKKGENQLLFLITEGFGGGGFMCQDGKAVYIHPDLKAGWETSDLFKIPETAVYYEDAFYISNFDGYNMGNQGSQFISKLTLDGKITELKWLTGLNNPVGMTVFKNKLFVLELRSLVEVDLKQAQVIKRHPVPGAMFLNDIAVDESGNVYFSDSRTNLIFHFFNGQISEWLKDPQIQRPNGVHLHQGELFVVCNGDQSLKAINLENKKIRKITQFGAGILDGVESDRNGNLMVSQVEGKLFRISPAGVVTKLLDTSVPQQLIGNFKYIPEKELLVVPTYLTNKVVTYQITE